MHILGFEACIVQVHGRQEILRHRAVNETSNGGQAGSGEDHVGPTAGSRVRAVPTLQHRAVEVTVLLTQRVAQRHTEEGLGGLDEGDVGIDLVLFLAGLHV